MSHEINTNIREEAYEWADRWEGTLHAEIIRMHLAKDDLDSLYDAVRRAKDEWYHLEERDGEYADIT
jgi:hypothetical protein